MRAIVPVSLAACACLAAPSSVATAQVAAPPDPASEATAAFVELDTHFRRAYDDAVDHHRETVVFDAPSSCRICST